MSEPSAQRINWGRALTTSCFLACSWTWVIGMFLPIYLLLDFGVLGWVAFAIPNVVGAGLVGWIWRRAGASERFVVDNETAMRWFSIVTIVFHIAFMGWYLPLMSRVIFDGEYAYGAIANGLLLIVAMLLGALGSKAWRGLAVIVYLISIGAFVATGLTSSGQAIKDPTVIIPAHGLVALALASPALFVGFLACPHLDLTLHRLRQETPGATGTAAFVIGFGVMFLSMIVFTLFYVTGMLTGSWSYYVVLHIAIQSTFTVGAHLRELYERGAFLRREESISQDRAIGRRRSAITVALSTISLIGAVMIGIAMHEQWIPAQLVEFSERLSDGSTTVHRYGRTWRMIYESIMSFYALGFPAWLWIGILMGRGLHVRTLAGLLLFAIALAGPLFAWGYFAQSYGLIPIAILIVVAVGEITRRMRAKT